MNLEKLCTLLLDKMMSEEGENNLYTANVIKKYAEGGWTKKKMEIALKMIAPNLKELSVFHGINPNHIEIIAARSGVDVSKLSFVAMVLEPSEYLAMCDETLKLSEKLGFSVSTYSDFMNKWRRILRTCSSYVDDFLEFYILLFGKSDEKMSNNSIAKEMIELFGKKDYLTLEDNDVKDFREIYDELLPSDKKRVIDSIEDEYVKGVLLRKNERVLIVDGSNIAFTHNAKPSLEMIDKAFTAVGRMRKVPWPFYVVFDANFEYKLNGSQLDEFKRRFLKHPRISFHSPADERILEMASSFSASILTNDRYLDYPKVRAVKLRFDGKKVWEDNRQT